MEQNIKLINAVAGALLILLSLAVSIPLTIKVYIDGGGPWGFGIIGFPILVPLSFYILFGCVGLIRTEMWQRKIFIATHFVTVAVGVITLFIFPLSSVTCFNTAFTCCHRTGELFKIQILFIGDVDSCHRCQYSAFEVGVRFSSFSSSRSVV
jgi:hypothetical protein